MKEADLYALADELAHSWDEPELASDLAIEFSPRLTRKLGRCLPERRTVRVSTQLQDAPEDLVREVLCHELAHVVAHQRFGGGIRPHGEEWQALMVEAGYSPRRRMPWVLEEPASGVTPRAERQDCTRRLYEHRCPVCQAVRIARTPANRWRCAECVADGLDGALVVTPVTHPEAGGSPRHD